MDDKVQRGYQATVVYVVSRKNYDDKERLQYSHEAYCTILHKHKNNDAEFSVFILGHGHVSNEPALEYTWFDGVCGEVAGSTTH